MPLDKSSNAYSDRCSETTVIKDQVEKFCESAPVAAGREGPKTEPFLSAHPSSKLNEAAIERSTPSLGDTHDNNDAPIQREGIHLCTFNTYQQQP